MKKYLKLNLNAVNIKTMDNTKLKLKKAIRDDRIIYVVADGKQEEIDLFKQLTQASDTTSAKINSLWDALPLSADKQLRKDLTDAQNRITELENQMSLNVNNVY